MTTRFFQMLGKALAVVFVAISMSACTNGGGGNIVQTMTAVNVDDLVDRACSGGPVAFPDAWDSKDRTTRGGNTWAVRCAQPKAQ